MNVWNALPFDVELESSPLEGATLKELTDAAYNAETGTLTLTFADATSIKAGQAYLIKWDSGTNLSPSDLTFTGVTLNQTLRTDDITTDDEGTATITFMGTYKKKDFDADDKGILYLGAGNKLYYPQSGASIGAQRGYFQLNGLTAGDMAAGVRALVMNFGNGDHTTDIIGIHSEASTLPAQADGWYTIDGRRLNGKPTQKGIYINNNQKNVIK